MKVNNKKKNDKETVRINIGVSILLAVVLSFVSIGYAVYGQKLNILGNVTFENNQGNVEITRVTFVTASSYNASATPAVSEDRQSIDFNLTFAKEQGTSHNDYRAVFEITIENDTYYDYGFTATNFQPVIQNSQGVDVDASYLSVYLSENSPQLGSTIPAGESITFQIYMDFDPPEDDTYTVEGDMGTELEEQPHGSIVGSVPQNSSGNLQESLNHDIAAFTIDVISTFSSQKTFTLSISDTAHFKLVNQNGTPLSSFTIAAHDDEAYTFYVARVANAVYANDTYELTVNILYDDESYDAGTIELVVDKAQIEDTTPPRISNLAVAIGNASSCDTTATDVGTVNLTWNTTIPDSGIKSFYATAYNADTDAVIGTQNAGKSCSSGTCSYTYTGLSTTTNNYYFKVYGVNGHDHGDTPAEIAEYGATVNPQTSYSWRHSVTLKGNSYMATFNDGKVNRGCTYTGTLNAKSSDGSYNYYVATSSSGVTVTVGGTDISTAPSDDETRYFTYTPSSSSNPKSASISIYNVNDNVDITVNGTRASTGGC